MAFNFKTATHDKLTVEFDRLGKVMDSTQHLQKKSWVICRRHLLLERRCWVSLWVAWKMGPG